MKNTIERIIDAPPHHWVGNGFRVHNFLPHALGSNDRMSPFFLLDYNPLIRYEPSAIARGVGVHPHRGMETVTIAYKGKVAHHDSAGNSGTISQGDVQWMTAGSGILHKEFQEQDFVEQGGDFQMVQLWVNLPAKHKMTQPAYQELPNASLGKYTLPNNGGYINVIAGEYLGVKGPARTFTPINLLDAHLKSGSEAQFSFNVDDNLGILLLEGALSLNNEDVEGENKFILCSRGTQELKIQAKVDSVLLLLSGKPINEAIIPYGPFLMNTESEIQQAFDDFNKGLFGQLDN